MRQLTSLDAQFLALENGRTHGHVGSIAIYDPATAPGGAVSLADLKAMLRERMHLLKPFSWRLVSVPFSLDHPFWAEQDEVDLDYHVRELALPAPGDLRQLADQAARIFERALDRDHPLWEMYLIQGLEDGRIGLLTKVHHAALDGLSGAEILVTLMDVEPTGREIPPAAPGPPPDPVPGRVELLARGLVATPRHSLRALRSMPGTLPNLDLVPTLRSVPGVNAIASAARRVAGAVPGHDDDLSVDRMLAPRTSLNRRISAHRRVALTTLALSDVKRIKDHFGVTVNDTIVAITAAALRSWLLEHDELPDDPLLAMVPVSVRRPEEFGTFGNRVSMMVVPIPTNEPDAARRVTQAHESLDVAKARHKLTPRMLMEDANEGIPPVLLGRTARALLRVAGSGQLNPPLNVVISNVPGSPVPLYCAGARLEANYPLSVITDGMGLNLTIISYRDRIDFGIIGDREEVPDVWFLADAVDDAFAELLALLPARARSAPRSARAGRVGS
ncbi:MAG TPA: wax ester/triacylglycerol synthase family O-acyltransferase [Solirubrobacteraceae bacterium]